MTNDCLLVINCQENRSYNNRKVLLALYGDRFPNIVFTVGASCAIDPDVHTLACSWEYRLKDNVCACCDPNMDPHASGRHATHPRLVEVAKQAREFETIVFIEDDCVLSPKIDPDAIRERLGSNDALIPYVGFCDRDSTSWIWTRHATGYSAFDEAACKFDRARLLRHWSEHSGQIAPPVLYTPMFGGFVDILVLRVKTLLAMVPDLIALQDVWHEAAIPSALMHRTARIGTIQGHALWGADRDQPREALFEKLAQGDYVHPIKLSYYTEEQARACYAKASSS